MHPDDFSFFINARIVGILVMTKMSMTLSFRPSPPRYAGVNEQYRYVGYHHRQ
jgi:hypothetical protein